jgi:Concanavalin A-like lectin/glucanases superfamily
MSAKKNKNRFSSVTLKQEEAVQPFASAASKQDNAGASLLKEETLVWILTILCTLDVYLVTAFLIQKVYHPDINELKETAKKLLIDPGSVRPEPMEAMLFRAGVGVITIGLVVFYSLFSRMKALREQASKPFFMVISVACLLAFVGLVYADFAAQNPFGKDIQNGRDTVGHSNFDFYFSGLFLGSYLLLYTFILVPLIACMFFFGFKKYDWESKGLYNKIVSGAGYTVFGVTVLAVAAMSAFYFPYSFENKYNFNAVYYSMTQVYSGSALLVDGFTNTYGLYPHFLNLVFKIIGLNVMKFSLIMGLLAAGAFVMNFFSLKAFVRNKVILFLGMLTVIFFPFMNFKFGQGAVNPNLPAPDNYEVHFDCNFAYYPIRYIIPSVLIILAIAFLKKRKPLVYWLTTVLMSFFVLWNPEIGLVCYLSWMAFNVFNDFYTPEGKINVKKILIHIVAAIAVIVAVFMLYKGIIHMLYGASPDLSLLFSAVLVFGKIGFNMLPMDAIHPWHIMALVLILGFLYAISGWRKKEITSRRSVIFLVSVIGVGFFFYFQGRSHDWQLAQSSGICLFLLTLLGDELWQKVKNNNVPVLNAFFVVFLFFISFSFFELVYNTDKIKELVYQDEDKGRQGQEAEQKRIEGNTEFIVKNSAEKEKIHVLTAMQFQGLYFDGYKRRAAFNPGAMDMFTIADLSRFERTILDSSFNVFIEPQLLRYPSIIRPVAAVAATYEFKSADQTMALLTKTKVKLPPKAFFERPEQVVHRKYSDDTAGRNMRVNDATGNMSPVTPGSSFAVEVLFHSAPQITQIAALIGNMTDTAGFLIYNLINTPNYFFGVNGKGLQLPVPNNQWNYLVMNVSPGKVEVFINGASAGTFALPQPMRQSKEKLFIGNIAFMNYYMGSIAEVAIDSKPLEKAKVEETWGQMKL